MQGRVLTSSVAGANGFGYGWVNRELIASGKIAQHINAVGGEDRIWLGPEGGQFSIFFAPGVPFDLEHWFTPAPLDTDPYEIVSPFSHWAPGTWWDVAKHPLLLPFTWNKSGFSNSCFVIFFTIDYSCSFLGS